jgi:hypothetical protein
VEPSAFVCLDGYRFSTRAMQVVKAPGPRLLIVCVPEMDATVIWRSSRFCGVDATERSKKLGEELGGNPETVF